MLIAMHIMLRCMVFLPVRLACQLLFQSAFECFNSFCVYQAMWQVQWSCAALCTGAVRHCTTSAAGSRAAARAHTGGVGLGPAS